MKMSLLKSIYMEILLIKTQTEITTFKTVMVTGWCQVTTFSKKNKKKYLFGATYSGVVVVFCNRLKRLNSNYKRNSKQ